MGELSEARRDLLESVAEEFLHNSWAGRRLVAVEAATEEDAARFADDLATVLIARGQPAVRRSVGDVDEATLRRDTIEPFRLDMDSFRDRLHVIPTSMMFAQAIRRTHEGGGSISDLLK